MARRLVVDALAARFGGTAYAAVQTARVLAQDESFSEVVVVARRGSLVAEGLAGEAGPRLVLLPEVSRAELARRLAWEAVALPREVVRDGQAVLLTWSGVLPRRLRVPVISLLSNPLMFERADLANRLRRRAARRTAGNGVVVAPTAAMAELAKSALGVPVAVVPHGVDHERFSPAPQPGNEVLCVADFYAHKRHDIVLDAWAALPAPRPTLRLIGDPLVDAEAHRRVLARADRYRELGTVRLESQLRLTELVAAYRRARVFVMASEQESFCMPLLEALACGVPAVARDLPALRETGDAGATFVAGDDVDRWSESLNALLDDQEVHRRMRARGLDHAASFSWRRTASELRDLILSVGAT